MLRTTLVAATRTIPAKVKESGGVVAATLHPAYVAGSGSASANYEDMLNKPSINGVELVGDLTLADLGIFEVEASEIDALFEQEGNKKQGVDN